MVPHSLGGFFLNKGINSFIFLSYSMHSYGAVEDYQQGKALETYLIVKHGIEKNCRENIKNVLLKKLDEAYQV